MGHSCRIRNILKNVIAGGVHTGASCVHALPLVPYLQQPQPLLVVESFHSRPEPANHYVVVMVTCGEIRQRWCMSQTNNK